MHLPKSCHTSIWKGTVGLCKIFHNRFYISGNISVNLTTWISKERCLQKCKTTFLQFDTICLNEKLIHIQSVLNRLKFYDFKAEFRRKLFVIRKFPRSSNAGYIWKERKRLDGFTTPSKVSRAPPVEFAVPPLLCATVGDRPHFSPIVHN